MADAQPIRTAATIQPKDVFGRLRVVSLGPSTKHGKRRWNCVCECGNATLVLGVQLCSGRTASCGCLHRDRMREINTTHGMAGTPEYQAWWNMLARCTNPEHDWYSDYGGRGIQVCERWRDSFENFYADMGPRPSPDHSLDRENNDGNYEPGNVRWATKPQQNRNLRVNALMTLNGKSATAAEWAEITGISAITIATRRKRGWSDERALTTPPQPRAK